MLRVDKAKIYSAVDSDMIQLKSDYKEGNHFLMNYEARFME